MLCSHRCPVWKGFLYAAVRAPHVGSDGRCCDQPFICPPSHSPERLRRTARLLKLYGDFFDCLGALLILQLRCCLRHLLANYCGWCCLPSDSAVRLLIIGVYSRTTLGTDV